MLPHTNNVGASSSTSSNAKYAAVFTVCAFVGLAGVFSFLKENPVSNDGVMIQLFQEAKPYDYGMPEFELEDPPDTTRMPEKYETYTANIFDDDKVKVHVAKAMHNHPEAESICNGPEPNMHFFVDEEAVQNDIIGATGYTVFDLDCRNKDAEPVVAFIVVTDLKGNIVAINPTSFRAEHVSMYSSDTVLYAVVAGNGVFLWNFKTDQITELPFIADQHAMQYAYSTNMFYGLWVDEDSKAKFSPSKVAAWDGKTGDVTWSFEPGYSHANFVSVSGDMAYLSLRSAGALMKVKQSTSEVQWTMGGKYGTIDIVDVKGSFYNQGCKECSWSHQHKFQHLDDRIFSLFDNHVDTKHHFRDGDNSRMVVLYFDEAKNTVWEVFAFDTGDKAKIYGAADILPSGNVLGNSYPWIVYPDVEDRKYHTNVWEVKPDGNLAMRIAVEGLNPWQPDDVTSAYPHSIDPDEEPPVGWLIYNAQRFYDKPSIAQPCKEETDGVKTLKVRPFNTIRTSDDMPGIIYLYDKSQNMLLSKAEFSFQKAWLPKTVAIPLPDMDFKEITMVLVNSFKESNVLELGTYDDIDECGKVEDNRLFK